MNVNPQIGGGERDVRGTVQEVQKGVISAVGQMGTTLGQTVDASQRIMGQGSGLVKSGFLAAGTAALSLIPPHPSVEIIKPMSKYNTFYKVILLVLFFTIFLNVIINIFKFFGIDIIDIYSYLGWFIFLMIILIFVPHNYSTLKLN